MAGTSPAMTRWIISAGKCTSRGGLTPSTASKAAFQPRPPRVPSGAEREIVRVQILSAHAGQLDAIVADDHQCMAVDRRDADVAPAEMSGAPEFEPIDAGREVGDGGVCRATFENEAVGAAAAREELLSAAGEQHVALRPTDE